MSPSREPDRHADGPRFAIEMRRQFGFAVEGIMVGCGATRGRCHDAHVMARVNHRIRPNGGSTRAQPALPV
jgi:hypothetical protein